MCGARSVWCPASVRFARNTVFETVGFFLLGTAPALAIPSPELIVGSFLSFSQLFALASALLGGGAAYATFRARRGGQPSRSRPLMIVSAILFALLAGSVGFNIYQYVSYANERQVRLEETLLRPSTQPGALRGDPEVKELTYGQQTRHPMGLTTAEADKLLQAAARGERDDLVFLDVREAAERAMGTLPGVTFIRYPDIASSKLDLKGKQAILFCHNGNRSHEACEAMRKMGLDCRFMVGGLEKWVVEGRAMEGLGARTLDQLRAIPEYRNRNTLLDTNEVRRLVADEKAIFVDVRYPVEFKTHGHLPNAINLTVRRIPTAELPKHIEALPNRPIILPCYDRRGCFFAEVLGYELAKAGRDVRGRFTTPWSYFVQTARPPHVEAWIAESNRSIWAKSATWLAGLMSLLAQWIGAAGAILLLALISRTLVLPFSVKAERDQIKSRVVAAELDDIKTRLKGDPVRRTRAIRSFYRRHRITPIRNLVALAFLPVMAIALLAVQELVATSKVALLWIPDLAQRDPLFVLPLIFGALITLYVDWAFATSARHRLVIWLTVLPIMVATGVLLSAGADIYLVASAALLLIQRAWIGGQFAALAQAWRRSRLPAGVISLDDVSQLADKGNKAYRLAQMRAAGMPVPRGLLLSPAFLTTFASGSDETRRRDVDRIWGLLGCERVAVRSSARGEDSGDHSFAGVFESVTNVDRAGLAPAITQVQASFATVRAGAYIVQGGAGSVLVQRMVDAEYAGVLFTRDPAAGGLAMIEVVEGTAENLVSGVVRPQTCRFGRITRMPFGRSRSPIDLLPLLQLGDQAERMFGTPQDIEWTYRGGQFYLVQSRDITRNVAGHPDTVAIQTDFARAVDRAKGGAPDETVFSKNELTEMLPRPTPLSLSLMEALWASGGSIDLAARELGLSYRVEEGSSLLTTILGRLYIDKREEKSRSLVIGRLASRRLLRDADQIERDFRESFLPQFLGEVRMQAIADFEKLSTEDLIAEIARLRDRFVHDTHVAVDIINIAASVYTDAARRALASAKVEPSTLLGHIPETFESHAIAEIAATQSMSRRWLLLRNFGHRAILDYELAEPRYSEDLNTLERMIAGRAQAKRVGQQEMPVLAKALARRVDIARRFQTLKEDAKHHSLRELAILRRAILTLDGRFDLEGLAFYLTFDEVASLSAKTVASLREVAAKRHETAMRLRQAAALPATLTTHDLEAASAGDMHEMHATPNAVRGTRVAGGRIVEGRACVVTELDAEQGNPLDAFRDGDIIVATMINPAWLPYFSRAGGLVSEVGGWLSHSAILAREFDVAMIVGTEGISRIVDGSLLKLHLDGSIEVIGEDEGISAVAAE